MHHLSIRILILCVALPPFAYIFSLQFLEARIQSRYDRDLEMIYIGDTRPLFNGSVRLQDALRKNIDRFLADRNLTRWGVHTNVTVKTREGSYLYPGAYHASRSNFERSDPVAIAQENYRLLNSGLTRTVDVAIEHNTLISNLVLTVVVAVALGIMILFYYRSMQKSREADRATREVIDTLAGEKRDNLERLAQLEIQRKNLAEETSALQKELTWQRSRAADTEEQMIDELVALEDQIGAHVAHQELQLQEIEALRARIEKSEKENESRRRQQVKAADSVRKRFHAVYKRVVLHDRAISGYLELTEEMKIKAEEVIHQLNAAPRTVPIKRKVFGKKNRKTVFEVVFAYKGRLYFKNLPDRRVEVLVIGTKLTQTGDLGFLNKR